MGPEQVRSGGSKLRTAICRLMQFVGHQMSSQYGEQAAICKTSKSSLSTSLLNQSFSPTTSFISKGSNYCILTKSHRTVRPKRIRLRTYVPRTYSKGVYKAYIAYIYIYNILLHIAHIRRYIEQTQY